MQKPVIRIRPLFSFTGDCSIFDPAPPLPLKEIWAEREKRTHRLFDFEKRLLVEKQLRREKAEGAASGHSLYMADELDPLMFFTRAELEDYHSGSDPEFGNH